MLNQQNYSREIIYQTYKILDTSIYLGIFDEYKLEEELKNHMLRVSIYGELLAKLMSLNINQIEEIKLGALFHDIGKISIEEAILNKPFELNYKEFEIIKTHSRLGLEILNNKLDIDVIKNIILFHHEKWNGKGYPLGLKETDIPIEARIVSIVDCYDALTSNRVYKDRFSHEKAIKILKSESGKNFDPNIILIFEIFEDKFKSLLNLFL